MFLLLARAAQADRFPVEAVATDPGGPGYQYLGFGAAPLADLDGDGFGELAVAGVGRYGLPGLTLVEGSASGLSRTIEHRMDTAADSDCCWSPASGDLDGDGRADLALGLVGQVMSPSSVVVLLAQASELETRPSVTLADPMAAADRATFGQAITFLADQDGDGDDELVVGITTYGDALPGRVYVYPGETSPSLDQTLFGPSGLDEFGTAVADAGDVDGDGLHDLVVGNTRMFESTEEGTAWLLAGGDLEMVLGELTVDGVSEQYGSEVSSAGDVNGDGLDDVLVTDPRACEREAAATRVFVFLGSVPLDLSAYGVVNCPESECSQFGDSLAAPGDVDGDGYDDVAVSNAGAGHAFLFPGSAAGLVFEEVMTLAPGWTGYSTYGDHVGAAGDLDGDGWTDLIVGDTSYDSFSGRAEVWMRPHEGGDTGGDTASLDTGWDSEASPDDTADTHDDPPSGDSGRGAEGDGGEKEPASCGCATPGSPGTLVVLLAGLAAYRRGRRAAQ